MKKVLYLIGAGATNCMGMPDTTSFLDIVEQANRSQEGQFKMEKNVEGLYKFIKEFYISVNGTTDLEYIYTKTYDFIEEFPQFSSEDEITNFIFLRYFHGFFTFATPPSPNKKLIFTQIIREKFSEDVKTCEQLREHLEKMIYHNYWVAMHKNELNKFSILFDWPFNNIESNEWAIFTTNYDTCLKEYFEKHVDYPINDGFTRIMGFDVFNKQTFQKSNSTRLFKLHGSVDWIELQDGRIVKIEDILPLKQKLYKREELKKRYLIYPTLEKIEYKDKRTDLIPYLDDWLKECKILIAVGFSFRDKKILDSFITHASKDSCLILISPHAHEDKYKQKFIEFPGEYYPINFSFPNGKIKDHIEKKCQKYLN